VRGSAKTRTRTLAHICTRTRTRLSVVDGRRRWRRFLGRRPHSNVQPLTKNENINKSAKLPTKAMAAKVERWAWPDGVTEDMLPDIYPGWATALRM